MYHALRYRACGYPHPFPAIALALWYTGLMKKSKEKPVPFMVRLYKKHRAIVHRFSVRQDISEAAFVREAIEYYAVVFPKSV